MSCQPETNSGGGAKLERLLPPQFGDWQRTKDAAVYDRVTIFDYINGAGEVYLQFGFRECLVQRYHNQDDTLLATGTGTYVTG
jgi:hypothetical protein